MSKNAISDDLYQLALNIRLQPQKHHGFSRQLEGFAEQIKQMEARLESAESVCFHTMQVGRQLEDTTQGVVLNTALSQWQTLRRENVNN